MSEFDDGATRYLIITEYSNIRMMRPGIIAFQLIQRFYRD